MESFQKTMQVFLEVQKATMLAYLAGQGSTLRGRPSRLVNSFPDGRSLRTARPRRPT